METVTISHPEKVLFPDDGITKGDLAAYYDTVATVMLPHLTGRPVTMERFHRGIGADGFFQKSLPAKGAPDWLERVKVPKKGGTVTHPLINDRRSLSWLANQNCITPHVWVSRVPHLLNPDLCIFDLDPMQDDGDAVRQAALWLRDLLVELGLESWVKTTGSKGFHVAVPLDGSHDAGVVSGFANTVGQLFVSLHPDELTLEFAKADRGGRIYMDTGRNHPPATYAAPYAVRARKGASVSAPCAWDEIESGSAGPTTFTLRNVPERLAAHGDPWSTLAPQPLGVAIEKLKSA